MPEPRERADSDRSSEVPFRFPKGVSDHAAPDEADFIDGDHEDEPESPLVKLMSAPLAEAEAVCARLESEGLPSEIDDADGANGEPAESRLVGLLVRAEDVDAAREVLARAPETETEERQEFDDAFYVEQGTCPRCPDQLLIHVPLPTGWRLLRGLTAIVLFFPVLYGAAQAVDLVSLPDLHGYVWAVAWMGTSIVLFLIAMIPERQKSCPACGWRSKAGSKRESATETLS